MLPILLAVCILAVFPATNYFQVRRLQSSYSDRAKEQGYIRIYLIYWITTALILLVTPLSQLNHPAAEVHFGLVGQLVVGAMFVYLCITDVIPLALLPFSRQLRERVAEHYDRRLYPVTVKQQLMFAFVAITVGICEEIMFRGFFFYVLEEKLMISAWLSFVLVSVLFGAGHFMQGASGVVSSAVLGVLMGYLYFTTGGLLVPILVHIAYDAKVIYMTRVLQQRA